MKTLTKNFGANGPNGTVLGQMKIEWNVRSEDREYTHAFGNGAMYKRFYHRITAVIDGSGSVFNEEFHEMGKVPDLVKNAETALKDALSRKTDPKANTEPKEYLQLLKQGYG